MGQLPFDSLIREFKYRASRTVLKDSSFARIITEMIKVFLFGGGLWLLVRFSRSVREGLGVCLLFLLSELVLYLRVVFQICIKFKWKM